MTNPLTLRGIELTFLGETKNVIFTPGLAGVEY
jgi:hypothetical protein